jgi:hypothetical protein
MVNMQLRKRLVTGAVLAAAALVFAVTLTARQAPPPTAVAPAPARGQGRGTAAPPVVSPEVASDRRVTFRILAPNANARSSMTGSLAAP